MDKIYDTIISHQAQALYDILAPYLAPDGVPDKERSDRTYEAVRGLPLPLPTPSLAAVMALLSDILEANGKS